MTNLQLTQRFSCNLNVGKNSDVFILYLLQFLKSRVYPGFAAQNPGSEPAKNRRVTRVVGLPGTRVRSPN